MRARNLVALAVGGYAVGAAGSAGLMRAVLRRKYRGSGHLPERSRPLSRRAGQAYLNGPLDGGPDIDIMVVPYVDPRQKGTP